jgi:hypothetical protein
MAGNISNYLQAKALDYFFSDAAYSPPATTYIALYSVAPTNAGGGTEATGSGYARSALTNNATNWPAATGSSPSTKANGTVASFGPATGDWSSGSNMVAFGVFDALSSGNLLWWGTLTEAKPVLNGDTPSFAIGALQMTLD